MNKQLRLKLSIVIAILLVGLQPNLQAQTCSVNAGVNAHICISSAMILNGNSTGALSTTAQWALVSGPNVPTITSPTSATTTVTGYVAGTYLFRYFATCSDASLASDTVQVIVDAIPVFTAGTDAFVCGTTRTMNATLPSGATGVWNTFAKPGTVSTAPSFSSTAPNAVMSNITTIPSDLSCPKSYYAIYTVTQGLCVARDTAEVSFGGQGSASTLGYPDATICGTTYSPAPSTVYTYYAGCGFSFSYVQLTGPSIATMTNVYGSNSLAFLPLISSLIKGNYTFAVALTKCDGVVLRDTFNLTVGTTTAVTDPNFFGISALCPYQFDSVYYMGPSTTLLPNETLTYDFSSILLLGGTPPSSSPIAYPTVDTIGNILRWRNVPHPDTSATKQWYFGIKSTVSNGTCSIDKYTYLTMYPPMNRVYQPVINAPCGQTIVNISVPTYGTNDGYDFTGFVVVSKPAGAPDPAFSTVSNIGISVVISQTGKYVFSFKYYKGSTVCEVKSAIVEVNVSSTAGASNAGTDQVLTCGVDSTTLAGNVPPAGQVGTWQLVSGPSTAVLTNPHSASLLVKNLLPGVYKFRWSIASGSTCPASSDDMQVITSSISPTANAGPDRSVCYGYSTALSANAPSLGATGRWRQIGGPAVTIADTTAANTTFSGSVASTVYTFTWTLRNTCGSDTDTVVITTTAFQGPSNAVISTADACITTAGFSSTSLSAVSPTTGTGVWSQLSGPATATITSPSSASTTVSGMSTLGEYKFIWTVRAAGCDTLRDTVSIANRGPSALTANAGADKYICADTVRMTALSPTVGIGTWTQIGGSGSTIDSVNKPTALISGLASGGTYDYVWTLNLGVCPASRDTVHIGVSNPPSIAIAGTDTFICNNVLGVGLSLSLPLNATAPVSGIGAWSIIESPIMGATIANPASASTTGSFYGGITKLGWTVVNGICPVSRDTLVVEIVPKADIILPTASLCASISYNLSATQAGRGSGLWSQISGPTTATITKPNSPNTNIQNMSNGVYKFKYQVSHPTVGCNSADSITITNSAMPTANARRDSVFCYKPTGTALYLIADTPALGTGIWSRISGLGTVTFSPTASSNPSTANISAAGTGLQQFKWTVTNGACQAIDVKDVLIEQLPKPTILFTPLTACRDSFTVTGSAPSVALNYAWSFPNARIKDTSGIGLTGPIANNFLIVDTNSIYLTITNPSTGCTSIDSTSVIVNCASVPLPLNFLSIQTKVKECSVQLQWDFNVDGNSKLSHFVIERSNDGRNFENLATLQKDVDSYVDNPSGGAVWYYRIKAVGLDNELTYSPTQITNTSNCAVNELSVYPNPTSQHLIVVLKNNSINNRYQLIDALGKAIMQGSLNANNLTKLDVSTLPSGVYMLKVLTDGSVNTQQVYILK